MNNPLKTLDVALQEGLEEIEAASDTVEADAAWNRWGGVMLGYFMSGAVSQVEVLAAQAELRKTYNTIKSHALLCEQWRAANPEEASA